MAVVTHRQPVQGKSSEEGRGEPGQKTLEEHFTCSHLLASQCVLNFTQWMVNRVAYTMSTHGVETLGSEF